MMRSYAMMNIQRTGGKITFKILKTERNTSRNNAHTNETETKQEVENDPPDILDTEKAIQSVRSNKAPSTDNIHIKPYKKEG